MIVVNLSEIYKEIMEQEEIPQYKIYCDMDGVLCDFNKRFEEFGKMLPKEYESKYGTKQFWKLIDDEIGVRFWVGMPWMPQGEKLWKYIKPFKPTILSSPSRDESSRIGKGLWVKRNIPGTPLKLSWNKEQYATPTSILIDDRESNITKWKSAGGIGIRFISTDQVINELAKLGL